MIRLFALPGDRLFHCTFPALLPGASTCDCGTRSCYIQMHLSGLVESHGFSLILGMNVISRVRVGLSPFLPLVDFPGLTSFLDVD